MNTNKLISVVPLLADRLTAELVTSPRAPTYPAVADLATQLAARLDGLAPSDLEVALSVDLEEKQQIEAQLDEFFTRFVTSAYRMTVAGEVPEWLLRRRKKTAEWYDEAFTGLRAQSAETHVLVDQQADPLTVADAERLYARWQEIYSAQQSKDETMQRVAELVDIKKAYVGLLGLLNVPTMDIQGMLYA